MTYNPESAWNESGYSQPEYAKALGVPLGYGPEQETLTATRTPGRGGFQLERGMEAPLVYSGQLSETLSQLSAEDQALLAIDMFAIGVYDDINDMFNDNNEIDQSYFVNMVNRTVSNAATSFEYGLNTDFLDVLLRNTSRTPEELTQLLAQKKAESRSKGGRIINYIDPVGLVDVIKTASSSVTGRMATPEEQKAFVGAIHGLQASGVGSIDVGARAEAFVRQQRPNEAAAMDYANAAGMLMQVLGIGGR